MKHAPLTRSVIALLALGQGCALPPQPPTVPALRTGGNATLGALVLDGYLRLGRFTAERVQAWAGPGARPPERPAERMLAEMDCDELASRRARAAVRCGLASDYEEALDHFLDGAPGQGLPSCLDVVGVDAADGRLATCFAELATTSCGALSGGGVPRACRGLFREGPAGAAR